MEAKIHYHICWSDSSIDWKAFPTKEEASDVAGKIKQPNESYIIVERGDECERCQLFKSMANPAS
jgi:hypothetical protein